MRKKDIEYLKKYLPPERLENGLSLLEQGVSPQYIVGNVDFYGNLIQVNPNVLIPRFETELLVEKTIDYIRKFFSDSSCLRILDLGTGSGCIAISLKKVLNCQVVGVDISDVALEVARENAKNNGVFVDFVLSDLFSQVEGLFDVIVSNPPYIREDEEIMDLVRNNEPHLALYAKENGFYFYRKILEEASVYLKDQFLIAFEIGYQQANEVRKLAYRYLGNHIQVIILKDYSDRERFVFISSFF